MSWILTVSYQLFTDTAVKSVASYANLWLPSAGTWINSNVQTLVFIYAFTWIFVLSSVIPSAILGKHRGVLVQYIVVLILTLLAFFMADILQIVGGIQINDLLAASNILTNPILAVVYLAGTIHFHGCLRFPFQKGSKRHKTIRQYSARSQ